MRTKCVLKNRFDKIISNVKRNDFFHSHMIHNNSKWEQTKADLFNFSPLNRFITVSTLIYEENHDSTWHILFKYVIKQYSRMKRGSYCIHRLTYYESWFSLSFVIWHVYVVLYKRHSQSNSKIILVLSTYCPNKKNVFYLPHM